MEELGEKLTERAGRPMDLDYSIAVDKLRMASPDQLEPLLAHLRKGVADLEAVLTSSPSVSVAGADPSDTSIRPRQTEYDDWVREELGIHDDPPEPEGLTVL